MGYLFILKLEGRNRQQHIGNERVRTAGYDYIGMMLVSPL